MLLYYIHIHTKEVVTLLILVVTVLEIAVVLVSKIIMKITGS